MPDTDWREWHRHYDDPGSALAQRRRAVQLRVAGFLDERRGESLSAVSVCAGDGRDLLDLIACHPARRLLQARLVEQDVCLAESARAVAAERGLRSVEVVTGDASTTTAYAGFGPADLILVCGVFGNISAADVQRTVQALPQLCAARASVLWTRHRRRPDLTPRIREWFREAGFAEVAFESPGRDSWSVGLHELRGDPHPLRAGERLFTFLR